MGYLSDYEKKKKNNTSVNTNTSSSGGGYLSQYEAQQAANPPKKTTPTPQPTATPTPKPTQNNFNVGNFLSDLGNTIKSAIQKAIPQTATKPTLFTPSTPPDVNIPLTNKPQANKLQLMEDKVAAPSAQLNDKTKQDILMNKTPNIIDTLLKPLTYREPFKSPIPLKPEEVTYAPSKLDLMKQAVNEEFPQTVESVKAVFKTRPDVKTALNNAWDAIKDPFNEEMKRIAADQQPSKTPAEFIGKKVSKYTGAAGVIFSPVNAAFKGAEAVPVLGEVAKIITVPFTLFGEGGGKIAGGMIDQLPIDQKSKDQLKPAAEEVGGLVAQFALGKVSEIGTKKATSTIRKVGVDAFEKLTKDVIDSTGTNTKINLTPNDVRQINLGKTGYEADLVKSLGLSSEQWAQAVKKGISIDIPPEKIVRIVDKPYWEKVKSLFKVSKTDKVVKTPGEVTTSPGFGGYLQKNNSVLTPEQARVQATGTDLRGTPLATELLKKADIAEQQGKKVQILPSNNKEGALTTPGGNAVTLEVVDAALPVQNITQITQPTNQDQNTTVPEPKISGIQNANKYTSPEDFADAQYAATPDNQIGLLDSKDIQARDAIDPQGKTYTDTVVKIKAGRQVEPIEVENVNGKLVTVDGSNRLGAAKSLNAKIPVIYRGADKIEGLQTIAEVYNGASATTPSSTPQATPKAVKSDFPSVLSDYWKDKAPTAFAPEKLKASKIKIENVVKVINDAVDAGVDPNLIVEISKARTPQIALADLQDAIDFERSLAGKPIEPNYYVSQSENGSNSFVKVEGTPVTIVRGIDTFLHKSDKEWIVSEGRTGLQIASGLTRSQAVDNAQLTLTERKADIKEALKSASKEVGVSPRYKQSTAGNAKEATPPKQEQAQAPQGNTPSKIAKSIEIKAIEKRLTDGFESIAGYDKITIEDQSRRAKEVMENIDKARAMVRGEERLPEGLNPVSLITAMEEYLAKYPDPDVAYELANSPLVSETSVAAQTLRLAAERVPDSFAQKMAELKAAREKKVVNLEEKRARAKKTIKKDLEKSNLSKDELDWNNFLDSIQC